LLDAGDRLPAKTDRLLQDQGAVSEEGAVDKANAPRVDPKLLEILVCPLTRATLSYDSERQELVSRAAKLAYPIRDGVPIMLPEEARPII
jgi:uncharacterized protein